MYLSCLVCLFTGPSYTINAAVTSPHGNGVLLPGSWQIPRAGSATWRSLLLSLELLLWQMDLSVAQDLCIELLLWLPSCEQKPQTAEPLIYSAVQGPLNNSLYQSLFAQPPCRRKHKGKSALQVCLPWPDQKSKRRHENLQAADPLLQHGFAVEIQHTCTGDQRSAACVSESRTILLLPEPHLQFNLTWMSTRRAELRWKSDKLSSYV